MTITSGPSAAQRHLAGSGPAPGIAPDVRLLDLQEIAALPDGLGYGPLSLEAPSSRPCGSDVLTFVSLDAPPAPGTDLARTAAALRDSPRILVGIAQQPLSAELLPLAEALTLTLSCVSQTGRAHITVADPPADAARLAAAVDAAPRAALTLAGVLRLSSGLPVGDALTAESLAYSALQSGPEFAAWRARRAPRPVPPAPADPVLVERVGDTLRMTLNHPDRRNALGTAVRDALIEGLEILAADPGIRSAQLRGLGPDFCSGGDLDEFGTAADPATAHLVRLARSPGRLVHRNAGRVTALVHGACVGAGIEVPAFAGRVVADPGAWFCLPELGLGLIPGAGGTVSLPRRIGRWRTAWMALTGARVPVSQALEWGLVDHVAPLPAG